MADNATIVSLLHEHLTALGLDPVQLVGPLVRQGTLGTPEVWKSMLDRAANASKQGAFGLRVAQRLSVRHLGILGYLLTSCGSTHEALERAAHYQALVSSGNPMTWHINAEQVEISWPALRCVTGQVWDELTVGCAVRFAQLLSDHHAKPCRVDFVGEPLDLIDTYDEMLGCEVRFRQAIVRICYPLELLQQGIPRADPVLLELLIEQAEAKLQAVDPHEGDLRKQRQMLLGLIPTGRVRIEDLAEQNGMSTRSLQRRLAASGSSFQALLDGTRQHLAKQYLGKAGLSIQEVAALLGYQEQSSFTRAFQQWTGETPGHFRRKLLRLDSHVPCQSN